MINRIIISLCLVFSISFLSAEDKPWWEIGIETEDNQKLEELEKKVDQNAKNIEAISDLGTGGGIPGIPIGITTNLRVNLIDVKEKYKLRVFF